jgi:hypothetical protein
MTIRNLRYSWDTEKISTEKSVALGEYKEKSQLPD